jgi:hypothetical protein
MLLTYYLLKIKITHKHRTNFYLKLFDSISIFVLEKENDNNNKTIAGQSVAAVTEVKKQIKKYNLFYCSIVFRRSR